MQSRAERRQRLFAKQLLVALPYSQELAAGSTKGELTMPFRRSLEAIAIFKRDSDDCFDVLSSGLAHSERPEINLARREFDKTFREATEQTTSKVLVGTSVAELHPLLLATLEKVCLASADYVFALLRSYQDMGVVGTLERHDSDELASVTFLKPYSRREDEEAALESMLDGMEEPDFSMDDLYANPFSQAEAEPGEADQQAEGSEPTLWKHIVDFYVEGSGHLPARLWQLGRWSPLRKTLEIVPPAWKPYLRVTYGATCSIRTEALADDVESPDMPVNHDTTQYVLHFFNIALATWTSADVAPANSSSMRRLPSQFFASSSLASRTMFLGLLAVGCLLVAFSRLGQRSDSQITSPLDQPAEQAPPTNPFARPADELRSELLSDLERFDDYYQRRSSR